MDDIQYRMLHLLYRCKKYPGSQITDKRLYGSKHIMKTESEIDAQRYILVTNGYITQYPVGWYRLTTLGKHEFKQERIRLVREYFEKHWQWILAVIAGICTGIGYLIKVICHK